MTWWWSLLGRFLRILFLCPSSWVTWWLWVMLALVTSPLISTFGTYTTKPFRSVGANERHGENRSRVVTSLEVVRPIEQGGWHSLRAQHVDCESGTVDCTDHTGLAHSDGLHHGACTHHDH